MAPRKKGVRINGVEDEELGDKLSSLEKMTTDSEIRRAAEARVTAGQDPDEAVKEATEEIQTLYEVPVSHEQVVQRGRRRVGVRLLKGPAVGRTTEYYEDIAQILEKRGEVEILKYVR